MRAVRARFLALPLALFPALAAASPVLDPTRPGAWLPRAAPAVPRQEVGVAETSGMVYVLGGFTRAGEVVTTGEAYDPATDTWGPIPPVPVPVHHPGTAALAGRVYLIGGLAGVAFEPVAGAYAYDPGALDWRTLAALPAPRGALALAALDGLLYAVGGVRDGRSVGDLAAYDPAADAWTELPPMPTPRDHLTVGVVGGRLYAVGGRDTGVTLRLAAVEEYDPRARRWRRGLAPLPTPRSGIAGTVVAGRLLVFGGEGNPDDPLGMFEQTEAYDPESDTWARLAPMPVPRHGTGAATVGDAALVPAGATRQGFGVSDTNQLFSPALAEGARLLRAVVRPRRRGRVLLRLALPADAPGPTVQARLVLAGVSGPVADLLLPAAALTRAGARVTVRARGIDLRALRGTSLAVGLTLDGRTFVAAARLRRRGGVLTQRRPPAVSALTHTTLAG